VVVVLMLEVPVVVLVVLMVLMVLVVLVYRCCSPPTCHGPNC
jgi:hypothetical protein